jgi:putative PIN family toxin of toxin-antitoxin system
MRVVVDTNVLISAALKQNSPPEAAVLAIYTQHTLLGSVSTIAELREVISRPRLTRHIATTSRIAILDLVAAAELVDISECVVACRDPSDDKFLELAANGRADVIVSGDADLLTLHPFRGIPIETPAAFLRRVGQS